LKTAIGRLWRDRRGTAAVEGAIVLPALASLLFGVYEFSFYFYQQQLITTGVRDAARYLARTIDPADPTLQGYAENIALNGAPTGGSPRVTGWTTASANFSITVADDANNGAVTPCGTTPCNGGIAIGGVSYVQSVTVATSFADPSLGLLGFLGLTAPTIRISHTERVVGPG
jgi:Flp pilus assembly protein TadG